MIKRYIFSLDSHNINTKSILLKFQSDKIGFMDETETCLEEHSSKNLLFFINDTEDKTQEEINKYAKDTIDSINGMLLIISWYVWRHRNVTLWWLEEAIEIKFIEPWYESSSDLLWEIYKKVCDDEDLMELFSYLWESVSYRNLYKVYEILDRIESIDTKDKTVRLFNQTTNNSTEIWREWRHSVKSNEPFDYLKLDDSLILMSKWIKLLLEDRFDIKVNELNERINFYDF